MKLLLTLTALGSLTFASVACVQPRPDTVVIHQPYQQKTVAKKQTTTTRYVTRAPSGPATTVPGSPQQIGNPDSASDFRATSP